MELFLNEQNNNIFNDNKITVFCEKSGRRYNTYIVGWNTTDDDLKNALEKMKKKFGCGGAIKNIIYEGAEIKSLNLQGNVVVKVGEYLKSLKLENLIIKELVN
jgi:translation initiation factor 1 (eIF-1/SUI1)